jgi:Icc-related predicted phosphoesterase
MRIVFATDIHGSEKCFRKFINSAPFYKADLLILGGDITGKAICCILENNSTYTAELFGKSYQLDDKQALLEFEEKVRFNGFYPYICKSDELNSIAENQASKEKAFVAAMLQAVKTWMDWADDRLERYGIECYAITGNDDHYEVDSVIAQSRHLHLINGNNREFQEFQVFGYPVSNRTPWNSPREKDEPSIAQDLENQMATAKPGRNGLIWNIHVPPFNSGLDLAPELTKDLKPILIGGNESTVPVGSHSVMAFIQKHQPMLCLHGHVHESRGIHRIGKTLCINPGSRYNEGVLLAAIVNTKGENVSNYQLVSG